MVRINGLLAGLINGGTEGSSRVWGSRKLIDPESKLMSGSSRKALENFSATCSTEPEV
jgi:hypothetical protein